LRESLNLGILKETCLLRPEFKTKELKLV
jgi:hypothetical protein